MDQSNHASAGWLKSTGFEGEIDTSNVDYRQSPTGTRGITLYGLQPSGADSFRGIQINFPGDSFTGPIDVPQPFPNQVEVGYFRQTSSGQRTTYRAKSGVLDLTTYNQQLGSASGTFNVIAEVEGTEHTFNGSFDIHTV